MAHPPQLSVPLGSGALGGLPHGEDDASEDEEEDGDPEDSPASLPAAVEALQVDRLIKEFIAFQGGVLSIPRYRSSLKRWYTASFLAPQQDPCLFNTLDRFSRFHKSTLDAASKQIYAALAIAHSSMAASSALQEAVLELRNAAASSQDASWKDFFD